MFESGSQLTMFNSYFVPEITYGMSSKFYLDCFGTGFQTSIFKAQVKS